MRNLLRPQLIAARLLRWLRDDSAQATAHARRSTVATPVDLLAERLGLAVAQFHPGTRPPGTLGYLEAGEDLIFVQQGLHEAVRRFTLAHEIGHAVLHRSYGQAAAVVRQLAGTHEALASHPDEWNLCDIDDLDAPLDLVSAGDESLRPGQAYSARSQRESEANAFAAALLLPAGPLRRLFLESDGARVGAGAAHATLPRQLAARFGVSEEVVLRRLTDLLGAQDDEETLLTQAERIVAGGGGSAAPVLDDDQRRAASSETPALIVAGPGSGKTSTLVGRVAHLVRTRGVAPRSILALTFSNKAAREMAERLERLLLVGDGADGELPTVSTIHGFCGELLRRYAPLVGLRPDFRLAAESEGYLLLRRITGSLALEHYQPVTAPALYFPDLLAAISRAKDELATPERYAAAAAELAQAATDPDERLVAERAAEVARVYGAYQAALEARGDPDFGDLIMLTVRLFEQQPDVLAEVRARHSQILVDEFQDINRAMGILLRLLAGRTGPLWVVGDADQAIYRFRGASPANLTRFTADYDDTHLLALRRNYRSQPDIIEAAAGVAADFLGGEPRAPLQPVRGDAQAAVVVLATAPNEAAELAGLARSIQARAAAGGALAEQAVLCRTRRQAQRVAERLHQEGIPTRLLAPLLEQEDVKDLLAVVALLAEPTGAGLLRAGRVAEHAFTAADGRAVLAAARERGVSPMELLARHLGEVPGLSPAGAVALGELARVLASLRRAPDVATGLARYVFGLTEIGRRLVAGTSAGEEVAREHALHLARLLALARAFEDVRVANLPAGAPQRAGGAAWSEFLDYVRVLLTLRQGVATGDDLLASADDGVWVLTVHASKGLEFPVVYLPGLAARRFPMQRQYDPMPLPQSLREDLEAGAVPADEHLTEEACLFYVAVTRARDQLVVSHAERYGQMRYQPSPFLAAIEQRLGRRLHRERWPVSDALPVAASAPTSDTMVAVEGDGADVGQGVVGRADEPLSVAEIETYQRCPRQYAYRYVYGLQPRERHMQAMRRGIQEALRSLNEARGAAPAATTSAPLQADTTPVATAPQQLTLPGLDEAQGVFDRTFEEAGGAPSQAEVVGPTPEAVGGDAPFVEVYRRHGRAIVQRAWTDLARAQAAGLNDEDGRDQPPPPTQFDQPLRLRVGNREVGMTLDRVERPEHAPAPLRVVRQRIGAGAEKPDLRALLYLMAAEQLSAQPGESRGAEARQQQLTTGASERVALSPRQLDRLRDDLQSAMDGIEQRAYEPRPDAHTCQNCPFLLICPA